jgi:hypothetical protein
MLMVNQLIGFGGYQSDTGAWQNTTSAVLSGGDLGASWQNYNIVVFIDQASLLVTGGTKVRLTLQAPGANAWGIDTMYIGQAAAGYSATSPAFAATPVQVLFNTGSATFVLASGAGDLLSDEVTIAIPAANGLCLAWHTQNTAGRGNIAAHATLPANWKTSHKGPGADDAATVAKSGYTDFTGTAHAYGVKLIEVFA